MNTNRLSEKILDILNKQVTKEAYAAQTYLTYAIWADDHGYAGIANLLYRHSGEERNHMMKVIQYIQNRGGKAQISALDAGPEDPSNIQDCFEKIFQHEVSNTNAIYDIVNAAQEERDWATFNFAQWFVKEQIEEENMADDLLDRYELITAGGKISGADLYQFDKDLDTANDEADIARDASIEGE